MKLQICLRKNIFLILLGIFCLLCFSEMLFANDAVTSFTDEAKTFSISYPSTWKTYDTPVLSFHASTNGQSPLDSNVKVISQKQAQDVDLKKYVQNSKEAFKKYWEVLKEEEGTLGVLPYIRLTLNQSLDGSTKSKNIKYFIAVKNAVYVVSFSSSLELFDQSLPVFEKIWLSFKILQK